MRSERMRRALLMSLGLVLGISALLNATSQPAIPTSLGSEHRYRIAGKVRLLLFWVGDDDLGEARATWRSDGMDGEELALLIGSDPQRAPRGVNEWGYIREDVRGEHARVFGVRTSNDADSPDAARARAEDDDGQTVFDAICSTVTAQDVRTSLATVTGRGDLSYRQIDTVLDALAAHRPWTSRQINRPTDTASGFLIAFSRLMTQMAASKRVGALVAPPPTTYVYKDAVYDLTVDRVEAIAKLPTRNGVMRNLVRAEFRIRNHRLRSTTRFEATFGVEGSLTAVPVRASYQPNWWFKIRLDLDDAADTLERPLGEDMLRRRVDEICGPVSTGEPR